MLTRQTKYSAFMKRMEQMKNDMEKKKEAAVRNEKNKIVVDGEEYTPTTKAYKSKDFLMGSEARPIRILCEYWETKKRLKDNNVDATVLFFASARARHPDDHAKLLKAAQDKLAQETPGTKGHDSAAAKVLRLERTKWMCAMYEQTRTLARRLAQWGVDRAEKKGMKRVSVASGGGPGLMEAANRGASEVKGAASIGMGISLPFEAGLNPYVSNDLAFEYHYFFTRKYWMANTCHALVASPGGFGTCDELFELMTLIQTGKHPDIPIVLFSKKFWNKVINWEALVEFGTVSPDDIKKLFITDSVDEAYDYITNYLDRIEESVAKAEREAAEK
uniref:Cytokinin riboside 5'-monophosphate phosphoribohydrolase n=1 Tax=Lotharella globosa TaxID=91324 RepID=A0A6U2ZJT8_9EUKA|mmetsp:Transcript_2402/g.4638  ORF Transcript_2402/g.4638 Transcript_2402/m.4638 type:complete len:332 (+) Transcript_2402:69-1064(+)|eukprot:CAMPEP_0167792354 /NCGR_PEP_ID=MMETSP0111_2-20121227/12517_1 /TAXON_ID=91324 /ORGANISM="Lotharella globosa, Strain CCCM811" /LENGTH=331 /DNA_ID=CAMNT_0007685269 /DNA_START=55 /DNA_END=1050 /DNA_ORIENTATION=-